MLRRSRLLAALLLALAIVPLFAAPASAAISRSIVMTRAQLWADAVVPYSQSGWADLDAAIVDSPSLGWRRDCSGFASMCWNLPMPGASTRSLASYADSIPKESLQPGDLMLKSGDHAVIFGGWTDDTHTSYWAFEMSASQSATTGDGSRMRATPYPYWGDDHGYQPLRLRGITESIDYAPYVTPIEGPDRYATAVAASRTAFEAGSTPTVVLASGADWPDALGAAALAGALEAPVLLTPPSALPTTVGQELVRLGAAEVIVVGGEAAVPAGVTDALTRAGMTVTRLGGADRYATSRLIAERAAAVAETTGRQADSTVFIATGLTFPDALAASPIAYRHVRPMLLTRPEALSAETSAAIVAIGADAAIVLGGTGALTEQVTEDLLGVPGIAGVSRIAGDTRYDTALALAVHAEEDCCLTYAGAALANGEGFADALSGGAMAGRLGAPLLLTPSDRLPSGVAGLLLRERATVGQVRCLGGTAAIGTLVRETVALMLQE